MEIFLLALLVILSGGTLPLFTYRQFNLMKAGGILLTFVGSALGIYATLSFLGQPPEATMISLHWLHIFNLSLRVDSISIFFLLPIFLITPIALFYSFHYLENKAQGLRCAANYFFYSLLTVSMALVAAADNMITFALCWEIMSLSSYFLVVHDFQKEKTRNAGYLYFVFAQGGALFLFAAFAVLFQHTGSLSFEGISQIPESTKLVVFVLAFICLGSKAGILPLHIWLPHAHPAAPSHVSAVMSGIMIKMGIFGIIRFYMLLAPSSLLFGQIVLVAGAISGILGVVYALGIHDIKRLLAYSSVENIGIILLGLGIGMLGAATGNPTMAVFGFAGGLLHVLNHSIFKSLLFLGAGAVIHGTGSGKIDRLGGLMKKMPFTGRCFLTGSVSISGLPPFNGFVSELLIYFGAFYGLTENGTSFLFSMLTILSLAVIGGLAAACFTKVVGVAFLGEPRSPEAAGASEAGAAMKAAMAVLALSCFIIGVYPEPFVQFAFLGTASLQLGGEVSPDTFIGLVRNISLGAAVFLALLLLITLLRKGFYIRKPVESGPTWGCGFTQPTVRMQYTGTSYAMSMVDFFRPFVLVRSMYSGIRKIFPGRTAFDSEVDDLAEVGARRNLVAPFFRNMEKLRWIQHGKIQLYIAYIVLTIIVLLLTL